MAKKSKSRTRGASHTASTPAALETINPMDFQSPQIFLDRREYRPDRSTRAPTIHQPLAARLALTVVKVRQRRRQFHASYLKYSPAYQARSYLRTRLGFSVPRRIEACIRRWTRKEVLHAKRKTGRSGQRKPRRNFWSGISC